MQGSIRQRGPTSWELRVYVGRDPATGRKRYVTRTVRGGKRDAQRALNALVHGAQDGAVVRSRATVADLLEAWLDHASADLSPKTVRETRGHLDRNLIPALGHLRLDRLRADEIDRYYRMLRTKGGTTGRPLAPATIRRLHGILRRALTQGLRWGWVSSNAASAATPPRVPLGAITLPSPEEVALLYEQARVEDPAFACFVRLAAATGARRSELIALRWTDVDLDRGVARIARAIVLGVNGLVEKDTKNHASRIVAVDELTLRELEAHRSKAVQSIEEFGIGWTSDRLVFTASLDGSTPDETNNPSGNPQPAVASRDNRHGKVSSGPVMPSLDITKPHHPVVLDQFQKRASDVQLRIADEITGFAGSMRFVYLHVALFAVWMLLIESSPWPTLTLIVSLEAIFLSTFVMIGQNRQAAFQQAKADHDYGDVNRLLVENTELTRVIHELTKEVHDDLFGTTTDERVNPVSVAADVACRGRSVRPAAGPSCPASGRRATPAPHPAAQRQTGGRAAPRLAGRGYWTVFRCKYSWSAVAV